jgi:hypothetical protein
MHVPYIPYLVSSFFDTQIGSSITAMIEACNEIFSPVEKVFFAINGRFRRGWDQDISPLRDHVNSPPSRRPEVTAIFAIGSTIRVEV